MTILGKGAIGLRKSYFDAVSAETLTLFVFNCYFACSDFRLYLSTIALTHLEAIPKYHKKANHASTTRWSKSHSVGAGRS